MITIQDNLGRVIFEGTHEEAEKFLREDKQREKPLVFHISVIESNPLTMNLRKHSIFEMQFVDGLLHHRRIYSHSSHRSMSSLNAFLTKAREKSKEYNVKATIKLITNE